VSDRHTVRIKTRHHGAVWVSIRTREIGDESHDSREIERVASEYLRYLADTRTGDEMKPTISAAEVLQPRAVFLKSIGASSENE